MNIKRGLAWSAVALIASAAWLVSPIYQFYAYRGVVPLPAWGWVTAPTRAAETQLLLDGSFEDAGTRALAAMAQYRASHNLPSLSGAVAVGEKLVWAGAVGFSDLAEQKSAMPATLYRIGSTSKALTATALAKLVQRGDIQLDVPVGAYSSSAARPEWSKITARNLASHSSGIPHYGENRDIVGLYRSIAMRKHYVDVRDALAIFDDSPLLFEPGTQFHYSSLGTVLLGAAMSDASGVSYRELMKREVFQPAGMVNTFVDGELGAAEQNLAVFYYTDGKKFRPWRPVDLSHRLPGGGFVASPTDLVKLGALYFNKSYLSAEMREIFWAPQRLASGSVNEENYALGWRWREFELDDKTRIRNANHGGVSRGSQCWLLIYPDHALSMAFCTNTRTQTFSEFGLFYKPFFRAFVDLQ